MSKSPRHSDPDKFDIFPEQLPLFDLTDSTDQSIPEWEMEILGREQRTSE